MTPDEVEAWDRLAFHLENQVGFWFALVVGDDPRPRATLRDETRRWCEEQGRPFHLHAPAPDQLAGLAVKLARGAEPGVHWIRADGPGGLIDQWNAAASQLLLAMNERREAYRKQLDGGVVLEGRDSLKRLLRELAPDMFSIRAFIAEPGTASTPQPRSLPAWREPIHSVLALTGHLVDPDKAVRYAARLAAPDGSVMSPSWARAMLTATVALFGAGRTEEAERFGAALAAAIERRSREVAAELIGELERATLSGLRGEIARSQGDLVRALDLLTDGIESLWKQLALKEDSLWEHFADEELLQASLAVVLLRTLLGTHGEILLDLGDAAGAERSFQRRIDLLEAGDQEDTAIPEVQLERFEARCQLAKAVVAQGKTAPAREGQGTAEGMLRDGLLQAQREVEQNPAEIRWHAALIEVRRDLGKLLFERRDLAGARETYNAALSATRALIDREPDERWLSTLFLLQRELCAIAFALQDLPAALAHADHLLVLAIQRRERRPDDRSLGWLVALMHAQRAEILHRQGDFAGTSTALLHAWFASRRLPLRRDQGPAAAAIATLHLRIGVDRVLSSLDTGPSPTEPDGQRIARDGAGFFKRAVRLGERVLASTKGDDDTRHGVEEAYGQLCTMLALQGDRRNARRMRRKRRALHRRRGT